MKEEMRNKEGEKEGNENRNKGRTIRTMASKLIDSLNPAPGMGAYRYVYVLHTTNNLSTSRVVLLFV